MAALTAATALLLLPGDAEAQFFDDIFQANRVRRAASLPRRPPQRPSASAAAATAPRTVAAAATAAPQRAAAARPLAPLFAVVSIDDQHVSLYGEGGLIERSDISSGTSGHPTPTGIFGVLQKSRWHQSNIYSGAEMPFMQRLTWGGVAMHEGRLPGYPASHGCIRLPREFASRLFQLTRSGFRVVVSPYDLTPEAVAHPVLPQPRYWRSPAEAGGVSLSPVRTAGLGAGESIELAATGTAATELLDPVAYAAAERARAKSEIKAAEDAEATADTAAEAATKRAKSAAAAQKVAEKRLAAARRWLTDLGLVGTPPSRANLDPEFPAALVEHASAAAELEASQVQELTARADATIARTSLAAAEQRVEWLRNRIIEMGRRQETASILISRKDQRLYVRQALKSVFDVPITIRDPDEPIGNHAFVATPPLPGETALRWAAISMPVEDRPAPRAKRARGDDDDKAVRAIPLVTATQALGRVEIPDETVARLAELVWAGSSVIVTDHGIGHDGATGHDFAIETRH